MLEKLRTSVVDSVHRGHYRYKYMTDRVDASVKKPSGPADMEVSSDKLFCCRGVRNKVPLTYREELYHILRMTGPLVNTDTVCLHFSSCKTLCHVIPVSPMEHFWYLSF